MADRSAIEWTATRNPDGTVTPGATWNPLRAGSGGNWYCEKLSLGCDNCYSSTFNRRLGGMAFPSVGETGTYQHHGLNPVHLDTKVLEQPRHWKRPRRIFVCSMTDLFGEWVPDDMLDQVFAAMAAEPRHTFMLLTKRPSRMLVWWERSTYARWLGTWPSHIWAGTTIESSRFNWRANVLRQVPAVVRFISFEPLLSEIGPINLEGISWCIAGGESGGPADRRLVEPCCRKGSPFPPGRIPGGGYSTCVYYDNHACDLQDWRLKPSRGDWLRSLRDQCQAAGVAYFYKQAGGPTPKSGGRTLDGREHNDFPAVR